MVSEQPEPTEQAPDGELTEPVLEEAGEQPDLTPDAPTDQVVDQTPEVPEPETLEAFLARNEPARAQHDAELRDRENAGANRREGQLKRDAGRREVTTRNVQRWATETLGQPVDDPAQLAYFYDLAQGHAASDIVEALPAALFRNYTVPVEVREQALDIREAGVVDADGVRHPNMDGYLTTLIDGAVSAKDAEREKAFNARVKAEVDRQVAAETKALRAERAPVREGAPAIPRGTQAAPVPYWQMTREQREAMTPAERDAAVSATAGGR